MAANTLGIFRGIKQHVPLYFVLGMYGEAFSQKSPRNDLLLTRDHPEVASDIHRRRLRRQKCLLGTTPGSLIGSFIAHPSNKR